MVADWDEELDPQEWWVVSQGSNGEGGKKGKRAGVCLKGRALWGPTQSSYKAVGGRCKIGWGGSHWRLEKRGGGGIGDVDVPSGRVVGGALGGEGGAPLPSSKALEEGEEEEEREGGGHHPGAGGPPFCHPGGGGAVAVGGNGGERWG